jgi:hypothetical protein
MKKYIYMFVASIGMMSLLGCGYVTSGQHTEASLTGDAWYVKSIQFGLTWATRVYYCPKPTGKGPVKCIQAIMHDEGEGSGAPDFGGAPAAPGYGAPAAPGYGAPAAPGYGAPAAPGYGAPAAPGYGAPATPSYGAPATPGYGTPAPSPNPNPGPPPPGY